MLGIDGVRVLEARDVDGEVELTVETTSEVEWCRACARGQQGRPTVVVRDVTAFGPRARLVWRKHRWRCPEPACPAGSWTQQHPALRLRMTVTERARQDACRARQRQHQIVVTPQRLPPAGGVCGRAGHTSVAFVELASELVKSFV